MRTLCLGLLSLFLLVGCDTQDLQQDFYRDAERAPSGITRTSDTGTVLEEDPDDWRTAPVYQGIVSFDPPYPNPTSGEAVTLTFLIREFNAFPGGLTLYAYNCCNPNRPRLILLDERLEIGQGGFYDFSFFPSQLSSSGSVSEVRGLHRLFILDGQLNLVSYGDLQVN